MGSCGDLSELHEPLDQDAVEQHSFLKNVENTVSEENPCVEDGEGVIGSLEDTCGQQGTSGEECQNDNVGCGVGRKVDAVSVGWEVESVSQDENAVGLEAPKLLGEEGGVSGGSLNENVRKIDDSNVSYAGENGLGTEHCRLGNSMESIERSSSSKTSGSLEESHEREEVGMEKNVDLIETETEIENRIFTPAECEILSEKRRCTNPDGCQSEEVPKFVEEKNEGATYKEVENSSQISPAEVETSYLKEGFPCLSPDDSSEKCSSPHSCRPSYVTESESSKRLDLSHCSVNRTVAINFDGLVECLRQTEAQENEAGDDCVCIPKCHDMLSPSSQNCSWLTKTGRKTQTKRAARNRRNKAGASDSHGSNESVFKVSRRKRSSLLRSARSSSWGLTGIFSELFVPRNKVGLTKKRNQGPGKAKVGQGSAKQKINQTSKSSEKSSTKASAPLNPIRLKIKVGKETIGSSLNLMVPEMAYGSSYADPVISDNGTRTHVGSMLETSNATDEYITCKETTDKQLQCSGTILHHVERHSDVSVADACLEKDLDGTLGSERSPESAAEDHLQVSSSLVFDKLGVTIEKSDTSPGTSPDSEVINSVPDSQVCAVSQQDFPNGSLPVNAFDAPVITNEKKGGKNKHGYTDNHSLGDGSPGFASAKQRKPKKKPGRKHSKGDNLPLGEIPTVSVIPNSLSNSDISRELSMERLPSSNEMQIGTSREAFRRERSAEEKISRSLDTGLVELESQMSKDLLSSAKSKRRSKNSGGKRERSKNCGTGKTKKGNAKKKVVKDKVKDKSLCLSNRVVSNAEHNVETGNHVIDDNQELTGGNNIDLANLSNSDVETSNIVDQSLPAENAWVRCDDCYKWRRIPVALVDSIGQSQWFCKENVDIKFADCSIPQEKSNEEINVELGISDAEEDVCDMPSNNKGAEDRVVTVPKEYEFTHITTNQFLYRNRKTQTIDEIMVCHCKSPVDGKLGCGEECLNRMLNIECIQGTCPCGDLCSNQQFQNRNYAKMRWARCGKKGFGLRMEEDISEGQFLIEYVGEVLDMNTYEARQKEYASQGHKHFYFMTLNGSEVIDACAKGNLGRFINHSCDPNCRTEKWVVNGEICIGLFAIRDIKKDEEVTFDYNFVRVFGAAAKECYCGSRQCRGYIGGDPTSCEVVHQVDSDEEFPEPVMVGEGEDRIKFKDMASDIRSVLRMESAEIEQKDQDEMSKPPTAADKLEVASDKEYSIEKSVSTDSHLHDSLEVDNLKENHPLSTAPVTPSTEAEMTCKSWSTVLLDMQETISTTTDSTQISDSPHKTLDKLSHNGIVLNKKLKSTAPEHKRVFVKSRFLIKKPRLTGSVKKVKVGTNPPKVNKAQIMTSKSQAPFTKPKGHPETISDGHFETVEGKLNDLLDTDGGISKRKDAAKGYLKLLLLTAATGASGHGEAIQSNRDLSMILDALLKTRSRAVLMDIISKNGLQMLHNMMKQYRGDFRKIPILRKLLRVLEYLAVREILSLELINGGPPRPGMESFQESMLSLTEHNDKQVHQIARNFRDKWIPRHLRRYNHTEKDDMRAEFHKGLNCSKVLAQHNHWRDQAARPTDAITCSAQSNCGTSPADSVATPESNCETRASDPTKARKRKSRWDQDAPVSRSFKHDEKKIKSGGLQTSESSEMSQKVSDTAAGKTGKEDSYCPNCVRNYHQYNEETSASDRRHNLSDDVPPGFSSPINLPLVSSSDRDLFKQNTSEKGPLSEVIGHVQRRFNSRMPVSYGIPLPIMEQFGSPCDDAIDGMNIVPGMPFFPFPPIPPMPHHRQEALSTVVDDPIVNDESKSSQSEARDSTSTTCNPSEDNRSFTGAKRATPDWDMPGPNCQHGFKRAKGSMNELGRRYFRQQKWIKGPPWLKRHNQWGFN